MGIVIIPTLRTRRPDGGQVPGEGGHPSAGLAAARAASHRSVPGAVLSIRGEPLLLPASDAPGLAYSFSKG